MSRVYPEIGEAIAIHDALIREFGGARAAFVMRVRWLPLSCGPSWGTTIA